jgi:thymidylate synthase ThyX
MRKVNGFNILSNRLTQFLNNKNQVFSQMRKNQYPWYRFYSKSEAIQTYEKRIIIVDDVPPEANAMLQALYSRSPRSVTEHLKQVEKIGPEKFMKNYYVGYGHKSIGDCGTTTIFVENVSMLAAKAIQDWPLYNGQEASTRYLDFTEQPVLNFLPQADGAHKEFSEMQKEWISFYKNMIDELTIIFKQRFPKSESESQNVYEKAIKARAFDVARGFLPAGSTTYVAWHTNIRQAHDHLKNLRHHPLQEVRILAEEILQNLQTKYKSSFLHKKYETEEKYLEESCSKLSYYQRNGNMPLELKHILSRGDKKNNFNNFSWENRLDLEILNMEEFRKLLENRPPKSELHHRFRQFGDILFTFPLDFGSYRDLQRHRSSVQNMPLLTHALGFEEWYLEQLPQNLLQSAKDMLKKQKDKVEMLAEKNKYDDVSIQYFIPMGYKVSVHMSCSLPSAVYIAELRSSDTVHPTLRTVAQKMGDSIKSMIPYIAIHHDLSPGTVWTTKRGTQDIVERT